MGADALFREYWRRLVLHRWVVVGCTALVVVLSMIAARDALRQSMARLRELRINVMGVVLNAALEDSGYYYYQYEPGEPESMGVARAVVAKLKRRRAG